MDKKEVYLMLRDEMNDLCKRQDTYLLAICTLSASLWTIAYSKVQNAYIISYVPALLAIIFSLRVKTIRYSVCLISSYLKVFLEDDTELSWERMRERFYATFVEDETGICNDKKWFYKREIGFTNRKYLSILSKFVYVIINMVSCFIFWNIRCLGVFSLQGTIEKIVIFAFQISVLILQITLSVSQVGALNERKETLERWNKVKESMENRIQGVGKN